MDEHVELERKIFYSLLSSFFKLHDDESKRGEAIFILSTFLLPRIMLCLASITKENVNFSELTSDMMTIKIKNYISSKYDINITSEKINLMMSALSFMLVNSMDTIMEVYKDINGEELGSTTDNNSFDKVINSMTDIRKMVESSKWN